jgi:polar amino acid transport system substrate-binding protein
MQWAVGIFLTLHVISAHAEQNNPITASTLNYPPYEYQENGQAKGIAVEVIREAMHRVGNYEVKFTFYPWKRAVYMVQNGLSDILFNAGKNQARQEWGYYVDSVLIQQSYVLFKRRSDDFSVEPDFNNVQDKSIAVRRAYLYGSGDFRLALDSQKFMNILYSDSTKQSVDLLLHNRVDMFVGDLLPVLYYINKQGLNDKIDIVGHDGEMMEVLSWPTYILFSKQRTTPEFVNKVKDAMDSMKQDGSFQKIIDSYKQH